MVVTPGSFDFTYSSFSSEQIFGDRQKTSFAGIAVESSAPADAKSAVSHKRFQG